MSAGREWERYIWYCAYASAISFNCSAILLDIRVRVWVWVSGRPVATTKCHVSFLFQFAMCEREAAQQQIWFWTQSSLTLSANGYAILYRSVRLPRCVSVCVCSDYRDETTWPAFNSINVPNASLIVGTSASSPRPRPRPRWQHSARASSTTSFYCWLPQPLPLLCPSSSIMRHATKCNRCSDPYHVRPLPLTSLRAHLIVYVEQINLLNCISQPSCNCHAHSATIPLSPPQPRLRSAQLANTFFLLISKFG